MNASTRPDYFCKDLPTHPRPETGKVLVTGGTGYIGGRLIPELLERGYSVRIMIRAPLPDYVSRWPGVEVVVADALDPESLDIALKGIHTAFYLIHSLLLGLRKFEQVDIQAARNFRNAAENNKVSQIIYLGGLGNIKTDLSSHLENRNLVALELSQGTVQVTALRAGMIIGSGSASYEILVNLVKNTPVFFIPYWAKTKSQPIAIRDVIKYLVGIIEVEGLHGNNVFDIGGTTIIRYDEKLKELARLLHKKRYFLPALFNHPAIYGYLAGLLTPVPAPITKVLVEGCMHEVICQNDDIRKLVPFTPLSFREALEKALVLVETDQVYTRWSDSYPYAHELQKRLHQMDPPPKFTSAYCKLTLKSAHGLFESFCLIGGRSGWFHSNWMWRLRGLADRIMMGVGTSRGRRSASGLRVNDVIDFFRVENIIQDKQLLLRAEMKVPGEAWLEFDIQNYEGLNKLTINAYFQPKGFFGYLYWYFLLPFHFYIFEDLIEQIEKRAL
jgi:uncharacterized protein YbjT (DUF2867 family)